MIDLGELAKNALFFSMKWLRALNVVKWVNLGLVQSLSMFGWPPPFMLKGLHSSTKGQMATFHRKYNIPCVMNAHTLFSDLFG